MLAVAKKIFDETAILVHVERLANSLMCIAMVRWKSLTYTLSCFIALMNERNSTDRFVC